MFGLYENIGNKIQGMAIWVFIIEALSSIITGAVLVSDFTAIGVILMIGGPILSVVSTWILYAFGQLVEDTHVIREVAIYNINKQKNKDENLSSTSNASKKATLRTATQCECGELHYGWYCPVCGKRSQNQGKSTPPVKSVVSTPVIQPESTAKKSHVCKCGERFYGDICPICQRTLKDLL